MPPDPADEYITYLAANVRRLRLRQGMTQEALAEAAGIDLTYLQRIERGTANPSIRRVVAVADALGVAPPRLFRKAKTIPRQPGRPRKRRR